MRLRRPIRRRIHAHRVDRSARRAQLGLPPLAPRRRGPRPRLPATLVLAGLAALLISGQPLGSGVSSSSSYGPRSSDRAGGVRPDAVTTAATLRPPDQLGAQSGLDRRLAPPPETLTGYRWPLTHARLTQAFGPSSGGSFIVDRRAFHDGLDIASFCGDHVVAAHDGIVIAAGRTDRGIGWVGDIAAYHARLTEKQAWGSLAVIVVVDDGNGYRSIYVHLRRVVVKVGQSVHAGDFLGTEGATGNARGCHLHYGLFSPDEVALFQTDPEIVRRTLTPAAVIARIDPLLALPALAVGHNTWGWGARDFN
jgi:murein DD-endopeptidase MepM/ murein hydrolase activator NlpD